MSLTLRTISREQHLAYIQSLPAASHMQVPAWADVKAEWRSESLGWFDATGELVGAGLVLYRQLPKVKRYLAYLPEGPVINWYAPNLDDWLQPMLAPPQAAGRLLREDGPAGGHPPLGRRRDQVRHPEPGRQAPARRRGHPHRAARLRGLRQAAPHGLAAGRGRRRRLRRRPAALRLPGAAGRPLPGGRPQGLQPAVAPQHQEGREGRRRGRPGRLRGPGRVAAALRDHRGARPLPAASAQLLPAHVDGPQLRGPQPHAAVLRPARGREPSRPRPC